MSRVLIKIFGIVTVILGLVAGGFLATALLVSGGSNPLGSFMVAILLVLVVYVTAGGAAWFRTAEFQRGAKQISPVALLFCASLASAATILTLAHPSVRLSEPTVFLGFVIAVVFVLMSRQAHLARASYNKSLNSTSAAAPLPSDAANRRAG